MINGQTGSYHRGPYSADKYTHWGFLWAAGWEMIHTRLKEIHMSVECIYIHMLILYINLYVYTTCVFISYIQIYVYTGCFSCSWMRLWDKIDLMIWFIPTFVKLMSLRVEFNKRLSWYCKLLWHWLLHFGLYWVWCFKCEDREYWYFEKVKDIDNCKDDFGVWHQFQQGQISTSCGSTSYDWYWRWSWRLWL